MSIITKEFEDKVRDFADCREWKASWHWERDYSLAWSPITVQGAKEMLADLHCDGEMEDEIAARVERIRRRYRLADELRDVIQRAEIREIADAHDEDCTCEYCMAAGYV